MVVCCNIIYLKTDLSSCLHHPFGNVLTICFYSSQMVLNLLADSLIVAICHLDWLHGRKYGTVWYHPASSMFYLIFFHPLLVSGKIDWHASGFKRPGLVWSQLCSACCVLGMRSQFYVNKGIKHEFSAPYTPQQNGVVDRKNQTLIEMVRTMLDE
jgi:hypothetical protein